MKGPLGRIRWPLAAGCGLMLGACDPPAPATTGAGAVPPGGVARVGDEVVSSATVARVASAQAIGVAEANERALRDAIFAAGAAARPGGAALRDRAARSVRARTLLERLAAEVAAEGPATDAEIDRVVQERWWELDRPELRRAVHAVVLFKEPARRSAAEALAGRIEQAVRGVTSAEAFIQRANGVPKGDLEMQVEALEPTSRDGRVVDPTHPPEPGSTTARYSPAFSEALFAIEGVGRTSSVFRTEFGAHVAFLTESIPEHRLSAAERRTRVEPEVLRRRAEARRKALIADLRGRTTIGEQRAALDLTKQVRVGE